VQRRNKDSQCLGRFIPDLKQRFEGEARAISQLNHPHICTLHDIGCENGPDFLVMEFLEGENLAVIVSKEMNQSASITRD